MEKFKDFKYEHIDFEACGEKAKEAIDEMEISESFEAFISAVYEFDALYRNVVTAATLCEIRHTINTLDKFYADEQDYYDENMPLFMSFFNMFCQTVVSSKFRKEIGEKWGEHFITKCEFQIKSFEPAIIELMQRENTLASSYQNEMASSVIEFDGKQLTLPGLMKYFQHDDREMRKAACKAFDVFLKEKEPVLDELFDKLVDVRTQMGKKMGYETYTPLGYIRMKRYDYNEEDVAKYRKQIEEILVPLTMKLRSAQAKRIGVEKLKFYDNWYEYPEGNPVPCGDAKKLTDIALDMYSDLSEETKELFTLMYSRELLDLASKKGKAQGGYCTPIPDYKVPFIFANFNGTSADVETFTHETGHALNDYSVRDFDLFMLTELSYETAEIHSTSMEYFTTPYMERFFGKDDERYRYSHLCGTLNFMAYEVCVDEFQHVIYANPSLTPDERKAEWHKLEKKYMPFYDFDGNATLEKGTYWFRQLHIFMYPFYYIDYSLASIGALEYYGMMKKDKATAWASYLKLCRLGGKLPYRSALKAVGLSDPFEEGTIAKIIEPLESELGI